jgi:hypothetical protein
MTIEPIPTRQRRVVADRHFVFEDGRVRPVGDVYDRAVLNVGAPADAYVEDIAAHDRVEPDGGFFTEPDIADDLRALFDKCGRMNLRVLTLKRSNHDLLPLSGVPAFPFGG